MCTSPYVATVSTDSHAEHLSHVKALSKATSQIKLGINEVVSAEIASEAVYSCILRDLPTQVT